MFYKKKIKTKAISFVLVVALLFSISSPLCSLETEAKSIVQVTKVLENGVTYTITQLSDSDGYDFIVTTDDSKDKVEVNFHDDSLIIKEFDYEGKSLLGKEQYDIS